MTPERRGCDQDVRDRVTSDLVTTFLLEAGAGTGKTQVLVDRYVACVLDAKAAPATCGRVAAITFTEKAAGELRQRIREELERRAAACRARLRPRPRDPARARRPRRRAHQHHPRLRGAPAARVPRRGRHRPGVRAARRARLGDRCCGRLWEEWLALLAGGRRGATAVRRRVAWLSRLLQAGVKLSDLHELAAGTKGVFGDRYDFDLDLSPAASLTLLWRSPRSQPRWRTSRGFCVSACTAQSDKGFAAAMELVETAARLLAEPPGDLDQLAAALFDLPVKTGVTGPGGSKSNWNDALGGKDELLARYAAVVGRSSPPCATTTRRTSRVSPSRSPTAFARWAGEHSSRSASLTSPTFSAACATSWRASALPATSRACSAAAALQLPAGRRVPGHRPSAGRDRLLPLRARAAAPATGATSSSSRASCSWSAIPSSPSTASAAPTSRCTTRSRRWCGAARRRRRV